jgi:Legionella pneumophila major outer membrane protein precursor
MNKPMPVKARPPVSVAKDTWTWWIEGGAINAAGPTQFFGPITVAGTTVNTGLGTPRPNWGWEGAIGFDYQAAAFAPWHFSGQFRFGSVEKSRSAAAALAGTVGGTPFNASLNANQSIREDHWLVDFNVGRDLGVGNANAQWTLGVRVADLRSKMNLNGNFAVTVPGVTTTHGVFNAVEKSEFLGAGPRLGVVGSTPLGGAWSFDWLAGAAVLFGERKLERTASATTATGSVAAISFNNSDNAAVFNLDAQAGLSYWFNPNLKITASYRFDGYWNAIKTFDANGNLENVNRFYNGPMLRLSTKF